MTNTLSVNLIALLGTSADPPTCGHEALLKGLLNLFPKVITWASDNPIKNHEISLNIRHNLLKALTEDIANPQLEILQELSSPTTITTLERAERIWPQATFIFIIGSDLVEQVPTWFKVKDLFKKTKIGIVHREGWPLQNNQIKSLEILGAKVDVLPLQIPKSSSSSFRKKLKISEIPQAILPLIEKQNLYSLTSNRQ